MVKKRKKAPKAVSESPKHHRIIFYFNIVMLIGIISLTIYDASLGENVFDHKSGGYVLSEQATPTPTLLPKTP